MALRKKDVCLFWRRWLTNSRVMSRDLVMGKGDQEMKTFWYQHTVKFWPGTSQGPEEQGHQADRKKLRFETTGNDQESNPV